jgi:hypothetical protein
MAMSPKLLRPRQTSQFAALRNGLAGYWAFNESAASGDVSATNYVTGGVSLTSVNSVPSTTGIQGNARNFTTANSERLYASISGNASLTLIGPTAFSVAFWFRPNGNASAANTYGLVSNDSFPTERGMAIGMPSSGSTSWNMPHLYIFYTDNTTDTYNPWNGILPATIAKDVWHFICIRRDGNTVSSTFNGTAGTPITLTKTPLASRSNLHVGIRYGTSGAGADFFNGDVDELAIWSRALSDSDVSSLYNSGAGIDLTK